MRRFLGRNVQARNLPRRLSRFLADLPCRSISARHVTSSYEESASSSSSCTSSEPILLLLLFCVFIILFLLLLHGPTPIHTPPPLSRPRLPSI